MPLYGYYGGSEADVSASAFDSLLDSPVLVLLRVPLLFLRRSDLAARAMAKRPCQADSLRPPVDRKSSQSTRQGASVPTQHLRHPEERLTHRRSTHHQDQQYFSTHFTQKYLKGHMNEGHTDLIIKAGHSHTSVVARLIMGVDKRATITRNWAHFFDTANMKGGAAYAFAFEEVAEKLHLTVHFL